MKINSIKFEAVSFTHEGQDSVLRSADFEFPTDQIIWLKAEEGAGKSTLLQLMAGLQIPQGGKYLINDENVVDMSFEEFLPYRMQIGYSFDYGGLISNRSLFDNLMLPLLYHKVVSGEEAKTRVNQLLQTFDIKKYAGERPAHVPGRVRKIVCLLRSMVMHPQILLLDDPSVGIGQESIHTFVDVIQQMRRDGILKHIFISSYDNDFMNLFDHQIVHLSEGLLYFQEVTAMKKVAHL